MYSELNQEDINKIGGGFNPGGIMGTALGGALFGFTAAYRSWSSDSSREIVCMCKGRLYYPKIFLGNTVFTTIIFAGVHGIAMVTATVVSGAVTEIKNKITRD